jgi:serine/threonine protein phosphatase 1
MRFAVAAEPAVRTGWRVPAGQRLYVVGDLHGQLDLLERLLGAIERLEETLPPARISEIFLGDYVDRGPASAGVIDHLANRRSADRERICLRGNHEWLMQAYLDRPDAFEPWRAVGGADTLTSYGVGRRLQVDNSSRIRAWREFQLGLPASHRDFLAGLKPFHRVGGYFFVHAGLRPGLDLEQQSERDMLWIRSDFLDSDADFGVMVVHGHSPTRDVTFRSNRIGLDTGAYATRILSCVMLEADEATVIQVRPA